MKTILITLGATLADLLRSRASHQLEILALRKQLAMVANRDRKRLSFHKSERIFWAHLGLLALKIKRPLPGISHFHQIRRRTRLMKKRDR